MKKIIRKYRFSKFKRFMNGLVFAIISSVALFHCLSYMEQPASSQINILMNFFIATVSIGLGLFSMFYSRKTRKAT